MDSEAQREKIKLEFSSADGPVAATLAAAFESQGFDAVMAADVPSQGLRITGRDGASLHDGFLPRTPMRLGALLDKVAGLLRTQPQQSAKRVMIGDYSFDTGAFFLVRVVNDDEVDLTEKEAAILSRLVAENGGIVSRKTLLADVWEYAEGLETHTLETHIYRLRQKIETDPAAPQFLVKEGDGYRLIFEE